MGASAWIRIAFSPEGSSLDSLKEEARKAIDGEKRKHWAKRYFEGISFQELWSYEEWDMWTKGHVR